MEESDVEIDPSKLQSLLEEDSDEGVETTPLYATDRGGRWHAEDWPCLGVRLEGRGAGPLLQGEGGRHVFSDPDNAACRVEVLATPFSRHVPLAIRPTDPEGEDPVRRTYRWRRNRVQDPALADAVEWHEREVLGPVLLELLEGLRDLILQEHWSTAES